MTVLLLACLLPQLGTTIGINTIMPLLDRFIPAPTLNLIVAFVRNFLCMIKDVWPMLLARLLPSIRGRVPLEVRCGQRRRDPCDRLTWALRVGAESGCVLQVMVGLSQWAGTLCYTYLGTGAASRRRRRIWPPHRNTKLNLS